MHINDFSQNKENQLDICTSCKEYNTLSEVVFPPKIRTLIKTLHSTTNSKEIQDTGENVKLHDRNAINKSQ